MRTYAEQGKLPCAKVRIDRRTVLTTGQVAALCRVAPRTASKWCDSGKLPCHHVPMSKDRRIPVPGLVAFLRDQGFPIPPELTGGPVVALHLDPPDLAALPGVVPAPDVFAFGVLLADPVSGAVVGDADGLAAAVAACRAVRHRHPAARVALVVGEDTDPASAPRGAADRVFGRPVAWDDVAAFLAPGVLP